MKNSDMPAMPVSEAQGSDIDCAVGMPKKYGMPTGLGLTKREHFAGLAMAALIGKTDSLYDYSDAAIDAVKYTDALLAELNKDNQL